MTDKAFDDVVHKIHHLEKELLNIPAEIKRKTFDLRLKSGQPLTLWGSYGVCYLKQGGQLTKMLSSDVLYITENVIREVVMNICSHSVYSHENEIRQGYISTDKNYRVGICGTAVTDGTEIKSVKDITSLVFRIPREKAGAANALFDRGIDYKKGLLIVGEPSSGKTTVLKDIAATLSAGKRGDIMRVAVVDERNELSTAVTLGPGADVLKNFPKAIGMNIALRTLSPEIIICDELSENDLSSVLNASVSGVPVISSVHSNPEEIMLRKSSRSLLESGLFQNVVFLYGRKRPGEIYKIVTVGELFENYRRTDGNSKHPLHRYYKLKAAKKKGGFAA